MSTSYDDSLISNENEAAMAVLEPQVDASSGQKPGPCCEKCGVPSEFELVTVCRHCGWYPNLNRFVDVDQDFEAANVNASQSVQTPKPRSHLEVWMSLLPRWSWILIITVLVIVVESIIALFVTEAESSGRLLWSVCQLVVGVAVFLACHVFNFLVAASEDSDVGFLDVCIKPVALWLRAFRALPNRLWVTDGALAGATATAMSILVIGSIPYDALFDWGGTAKKQNLTAKMVEKTQQVPNRNSSNRDFTNSTGSISGSSDAGTLEDAVKSRNRLALPTPPEGMPWRNL
jgi:hypothetical protein